MSMSVVRVVCLCVSGPLLLAGCSVESAEPVDRTDEILAELRELREETKSRAAVSAPAAPAVAREGAVSQTATRAATWDNWTGAAIHVARGSHCVPCNRLKADLYEYVHGTAWRIGETPRDHWRFVVHDDDTPVPFVEYFRDGRVVSRIVGYLGDIEQIVRAHPKAAKS
jgi:hypothetical protein